MPQRCVDPWSMSGVPVDDGSCREEEVRDAGLPAPAVPTWKAKAKPLHYEFVRSDPGIRVNLGEKFRPAILFLILRWPCGVLSAAKANLASSMPGCSAQ